MFAVIAIGSWSNLLRNMACSSFPVWCDWSMLQFCSFETFLFSVISFRFCPRGSLPKTFRCGYVVVVICVAFSSGLLFACRCVVDLCFVIFV